jgi:hypothetical protein
VSSWEPFAQRTVLLKLRRRDDNLPVELRTDAISIQERADRVEYEPSGYETVFSSYLVEVKLETDAVDAGPYVAQIYLVPSSFKEKTAIIDDYLLEERWLQVLAFDNYAAHFNELFGDAWDDPVYLDTQNIKELNDFFRGWHVDPISKPELEQFELGDPKRAAPVKRRATYSLHDALSFQSAVLERVLSLNKSAMRFETLLPFRLDADINLTFYLPHIDLTKYFWLLNVLGSTWTDLFFFCRTLTLELYALDDSISLSLKSGDKETTMPLDEPPLFQIVRNSIGSGLNYELTYDSDAGINLLVRTTRSLLSKPATA